MISDIGHTVSDTIDGTAQELQKQYKYLKDMYRKYKVKAAPAYKKALKSTEELNKAVTEMTHKLFPKSKGKFNNKNVLQKIDKIKDQLKKEKAFVDRNLKHKIANKISNLNKVTKDDIGLNSYLNFEINTEHFDFGMNAVQAYRDKDGRSIKDVSFKALEEAKKMTVPKGTHKRDSNTFDKTDIFRINDYGNKKPNY